LLKASLIKTIASPQVPIVALKHITLSTSKIAINEYLCTPAAEAADLRFTAEDNRRDKNGQTQFRRISIDNFC